MRREHFMQVAKSIIVWMINPANWVRTTRHIITSLPRYAKVIFSFITFFIVLVHLSGIKVHSFFGRIPLLGRVYLLVTRPIGRILNKPVTTFIQKLESMRPFQVRQSYLVQLAFQNLQVRKSRTLVTIFGMSAGIGIIVYLLSLGYGIEKLVIDQVASLNELKIIDVTSGKSSSLRIDNDAISKISQQKTVEKVIPVVSLVGRVNFKKAQTDILVYGASDDFLNITQAKIKKGKSFTQKSSNELTTSKSGGVQGEATAILDGTFENPMNNHLVSFNILPEAASPVRVSCDIDAEVRGYVVRTEGGFKGRETWGSKYIPHNKFGRSGYDKKKDVYLGEWIYGKFPLFAKTINEDLEEDLVPQIGDSGHQSWEYGCIQKKEVQDIKVVENSAGSVLGEATQSAQLASTGDQESTASASLTASLNKEGVVATGSARQTYETEVISTDSAGIEFVRLTTASSSAAIAKKDERIKFSKKPSGEAIISSGLMKLLGLNETSVIGKEFDMSFIIVKALRSDIEGRKLSEEVKYKIVGMIQNDDEQFFYIPFQDLDRLGVENYSQLKIVVKDTKNISGLRTKVEEFGYSTTSSIDTVAQIESLFRNLRFVLASIGLIALVVASLGMFNTLTVSLLERTREIGGMKVIGMVSEEVQDLFLAEAMIMGFGGGIGGIIIGYTLGQLSSMFISIFSIANGLGYLQVAYIPVSFVVFILVLSFIVGILTGLYPAQRAKNTSALNALRYE